MANENAILNATDVENKNAKVFDMDDIEQALENELEELLFEDDFLKEEAEKIGNPDTLGKVIMDTFAEQVNNQVAQMVGEEFIEDNHGLKLNLKKDAHTQTVKDFVNGKIAIHNTEIGYGQRREDWERNFKHDENGNRIVDERYRGKDTVHVLNPDARKDYDKHRPKGSDSASMQMDHTVSAAEHIRDPELATYLSHDEKVALANNAENLHLMDASANMSKGDMKMEEWLEWEKDGKTPAERFNIDEKECRANGKEARENLEKAKEEAKIKNEEAGKKSRRKEAARMGKKMLKTVILGLLTELAREVVQEFIRWLKGKNRKLNTFLERMKKAIKKFVSNLRQHVKHVADMTITTLATAIWGPVAGIIKKIWTMLKQGWRSLKEAIDYIRNPENKGRPISVVLCEVGKIVIAGASGILAGVLGETIEAGLVATVPALGVEIPLLGSLANLLGIFLGALVAGIVGALAINLIDKFVAKKQKAENIGAQVDLGNKILHAEGELINIKKIKLEIIKEKVGDSISQRHQGAAKDMKEKLEDAFREGIDTENENTYKNLVKKLDNK